MRNETSDSSSGLKGCSIHIATVCLKELEFCRYVRTTNLETRSDLCFQVDTPTESRIERYLEF